MSCWCLFCWVKQESQRVYIYQEDNPFEMTILSHTTDFITGVLTLGLFQGAFSIPYRVWGDLQELWKAYVSKTTGFGEQQDLKTPLKWLQGALLCTLSLSRRCLCNVYWRIVCHWRIVQACFLFSFYFLVCTQEVIQPEWLMQDDLMVKCGSTQHVWTCKFVPRALQLEKILWNKQNPVSNFQVF